MKWVKRGGWLLAWGVWAWLGVGLYRELPRELGPAVCRVGLGRGERVVGVVGDVPVIVTHAVDRSGPTSTFRRWDARTGALLEEFGAVPHIQGPFQYPRGFVKFEKPPLDRSRVTPTYVGIHAPSPLQWRSDPLYLLDLATGRWLEITGEERGPIHHPSKPWALFWSGGVRDFGENYATVLDLRTGQRVFQWRDGQAGSPGRRLALQPFFVGDDRIAIGTEEGSNEPRGSHEDYALEIWSLMATAERPLAVHRGVGVGGDAWSTVDPTFSTSRTRRVAWYRTRQFSNSRITCEVFDATSGATVFVEPHDAPRNIGRGLRGDWGLPALTEDGRSVLNTWTAHLYDVDSGKRLWTAQEDESIAAVKGERFEMIEAWKFGLGSWKTSFPSFAVRRLNDSGLEYRTWRPTLEHRFTAADGSTRALVGDTVYELPPRVKWPVYVVCQGVLGLPLALVWVVMRWRRKGEQARPRTVL